MFFVPTDPPPEEPFHPDEVEDSTQGASPDRVFGFSRQTAAVVDRNLHRMQSGRREKRGQIAVETIKGNEKFHMRTADDFQCATRIGGGVAQHAPPNGIGQPSRCPA